MLSDARPTSDFFPLLNACLNGLAALFLFVGFLLVKKRRLEAHRKVMTAAFWTSAIFLASYLYYHFNYSSQKYAGTGAVRTFYFGMLVSHIFLAVFSLPFILRLFWLAKRGDFIRHRALSRWVWPVWIYVSVTGVLIYLMLYVF
jgi:putative membrane protein